MLDKLYHNKVDNSKLKYDAKQINVLKILEKYINFKRSFNFWKKPDKLGVYIYGSVGSGKTTIMDIFYSSLTVKNKERMHFNDLLRKINELSIKAKQCGYSDPIFYIQKYYKKLQILCIDEFEVSDITISIVMRRLLSFLLNKKCIIIVTSNIKPSNLYLNGLQRERFMDLIHKIENNMDIVNLDSEIDYRTVHIYNKDYIKNHRIFQLTSEENDYFIKNDLLPNLLQQNCSHLKPINKNIDVNGRLIGVPYINNIALLDFEEFCNKNYGYNDYHEICNNFAIIVIQKIPKPDIEKNLDSWRRLTWLFDEIYETKVNFYAIILFDYQNITLETFANKIPQIKRCFSRMIGSID